MLAKKSPQKGTPAAEAEVSVTKPLESMTMSDGAPCLYGSLRFRGRQKRAKWVAVAAHTEARKLLPILDVTWNLPYPSVLISVAGASQSSGLGQMHQEHLEIFKAGLLKAVRATGAWLVTGGTAGGVQELVGDAVREFNGAALTKATEGAHHHHGPQVVCLGVVSWGTTQHNEELAEQGEGQISYYGVHNKECGHNRAFLDDNHTHFLLVDDGSDGVFGTEIKMRTALERAICERPPPEEEEASDAEASESSRAKSPVGVLSRALRYARIPRMPGFRRRATSRDSIKRSINRQSTVFAGRGRPGLPHAVSGHSGAVDDPPCIMVLLVVSGGINTLTTVRDTLVQGAPVVCVADSGGAAKAIYLYCERRVMPTPDDIEDMTMDFFTACKTLLPDIKRHARERKGPDLAPQLTFFRMHVEGSTFEGRSDAFENYILQAVLSDSVHTREAIMHAVQWGEPDMIDNLLRASTEEDTGELGLERALETALSMPQSGPENLQVVRRLMENTAAPKSVHLYNLMVRGDDPYDVFARIRETAEEHALRDDDERVRAAATCALERRLVAAHRTGLWQRRRS